MENYSLIIFILTVVVILSSWVDKLRIPYPVLLVGAGIIVGFIPGIPKIELEPEIVFLIFLPPMLYDGAFNISRQEFRTQWNTISTLAIALVFFTASGIAIFAHYCIPGFTWPLAFTLGAILSATDAVAATSVMKGLKISPKIVTILEGESLINDASGLIAYRFSLAAVAGAGFVFWKAGLQFLLLLGGGLLVGLILGRVLGFILKRVHQNSMVAISFTLLMPFVAYLLAEQFHVSGVIAVVVIGLQMSFFTDKVFPTRTKEESRAIWEILVFLLNGLIFILIGLEFPYVLKSIPGHEIWPLIGYSFIICIVAIAIRMLRILLQRVNLERGFQIQNTKTDSRRPKITEDALLDWKSCLIIGWSGIRGIVSLATAIALPVTLSDGTNFPMRSEIIFISVAVVLISIVGQGLSLPLLLRVLKTNK